LTDAQRSAGTFLRWPSTLALTFREIPRNCRSPAGSNTPYTPGLEGSASSSGRFWAGSCGMGTGDASESLLRAETDRRTRGARRRMGGRRRVREDGVAGAGRRRREAAAAVAAVEVAVEKAIAAR
jgi:hypothetical protein